MSGHMDNGTSQTRLETYTAPKEIAASPFYTVAVNGKPVFVYPCSVSRSVDEKGELLPDRHQTTQTMPAAFCYFDVSGQAEVEVTVHGPPLHLPLKSAIVRPLRHGIQPTTDGQTLRFSLKQPCQLSVEPNGAILAPLFIFANPIEGQRPAADDPAVTYFGPGTHTLPVGWQPKSDSTVYVAGGAVVYGQMNFEHLANIRLTGRGILDAGSCKEGRGWRWFKCRNVTIEGLIMLDSPSWGIEVGHCDDVLVRNVKVISGRGADGIDVCSSENVSVENFFARTHDDTLNVKGLTDERFGYPADEKGRWLPTGTRKAARNIRFTDCVVWNDRAHALMLGPESRATVIEDILFRDIDIIHALSVDAIGIFSSDAAEIRNIRYENIRIEDPRCMTLLELRVHPTYVTADPICGAVSDVTFKNLDVTSPTPVYSALCGDSNSISRVTFENWRWNGKVMTNAEEARLLSRGDVKDTHFVSSGH